MDQNSNIAVLEKWIFENFEVPFYDKVIYKDDSYILELVGYEMCFRK